MTASVQLSSQEVFDHVIIHLRTQATKSTRSVKYWQRDEIECALRGDDGKKDPGGLFIEDREYDAKVMEGWTFSSLLNYKECPISLKERMQEHGGLLDTLNYVHDFTDPLEWENDFAAIALSYKLAYSKPVSIL